jgi:3-oxoacyl-[acyl-carrier-protein] synthase-3
MIHAVADASVKAINGARKVKIAGVGKYLPAGVVTNSDLESRLGLPTGWIVDKTGVVERRQAAGEETQSRMGALAARAALADAGAATKDVDLIICASAGYEQPIPCTAVFIQRELGLADAGVPCFDVNSTCLSFLHGLDIAAQYVASGSYLGVLVVSSEVASAAIDWNEHESAVLLGDGAAAVFLTIARASDSSIMYRASFTTDSRGASLAEVRGGGTARPNRQDLPHEMNLFHMRGPQIFRYLRKQAVVFMNAYEKTLPFSFDEMRAFCGHQANLTALRLIARACGFRDDQILENISTHGNCVAASIPLMLHDGVKTGRIRRGDRVLLAGTAAGTAVGALALIY